MKVKFTILGCGSSLGVPRIDGFFGNCDPKNIKNYRTRCSALISFNKTNILIDTSPDIKKQLLSQNVKNIDKVFYTHNHADQSHGINELRLFYLKNKKKIPVYADKHTKKYLYDSFKYCFKSMNDGYNPSLKLMSLKKTHFIKSGNNKITIKNVSVKHGKINSIAYIINNKCAYLPDANKIYEKDIKHFVKLKYLVIDCLQYNQHPSHFSLFDVCNLIKKIKPKKTILTNLNNQLDYLSVKKIVPKNVFPAYDGMSFYL